MKNLYLPTHKTIYLVRHGLSTLSKHGYGKRKLTADLLPQGEPAVERIARYLEDVPESLNISSDLPRCRHTAAIITRITGKLFTFDKRLSEYYHETFTEFKSRIYDVLKDLSAAPEQNLIICTHGSVIAGITYFIMEHKFIYKNLYDYPKEGELLLIQNQKSRKLSFN